LKYFVEDGGRILSADEKFEINVDNLFESGI